MLCYKFKYFAYEKKTLQNFSNFYFLAFSFLAFNYAHVALNQSQISAIVNLLRSFNVPENTINTVKVVLRGEKVNVSNNDETSAVIKKDASNIKPKKMVRLCTWVPKPFRPGTYSEELKEIQEFLKEEGYFDFTEATGYYGPATIRAIQKFQKEYGIVSYGSLSSTGFGLLGPKTVRKLHELLYQKVCKFVKVEPKPIPKPFVCTMQYDPVCGIKNGVQKTYSNMCFLRNSGAIFLHKGECDINTNNNPPVIHQINGPMELYVGEAGKWTVVASDKDNDTLSYLWRWSDEYGSVIQRSIASPYAEKLNFKQETSATHVYIRPGVFKISFTVKDGKCGAAESSISVKVKPKAGVKIPRMCKVWFDGCNTCTRQELGGIMACTQMYCPASVKPAMCKEWFVKPAEEVKLNARADEDKVIVS